MATPAFFGPELHVNTTTVNDQDAPSITALANGKFVAVWEDSSEIGGDLIFASVRGQVFNADGTKAGGEFLVNQTTAGFQGNPDVTALADGRFVVAWDHSSFNEVTGTVEFGIKGRFYGVDGSPASNEFSVSTISDKSAEKPIIAAGPGGGFLISWTHRFSNDDLDIHARAFDAAGNALSGEFGVDNTGPIDEDHSAIVALANANYVVTWEDEGSPGETDGSDSHLRAKILLRQRRHRRRRVHRQFDDRGKTGRAGDYAPLGRQFRRHLEQQRQHAGVFEPGIRGRVFSQAGAPVGNDFLIENDAETEDQPAVTALADGQFMVAWRNDEGQSDTDGSVGHIRGRIFTAAGAVSDEFLVNTTKNGDQREVKLTTLTDGRFVATWAGVGENQGDAGSAVRGQIFDARTKAVNLTGTTLNDDWVGTKFVDVMNGKDGDDRIEGGAGDDFLIGGAGADTVSGGDGADLISGDGGNDRLAGGDGGDVLNGFTGIDRMAGGDDDDLYTVENVEDVVIENADEGFDSVLSSISFVLPANVEKLELDNSASAIDATGNALPNTLVGNERDNALDGRSGADNMTGSLGNDTYVVDNAEDVVIEKAGEGNDTVISSIAFVLGAEFENLKLTGTGNPVAKASAAGVNGTGNALANTITGSDAANLLDGGIGNDLLGGRGGRDKLLGGLGDDRLSGGLGKDKLSGGDGSDSFLFDEALGKANADKIQDFKAKADTILFDVVFFDGIGLGALKKKAYFEGDAAHDKSDRVILTDKGELLFDADGKGGDKALLFAKVGKDADLSQIHLRDPPPAGPTRPARVEKAAHRHPGLLNPDGPTTTQANRNLRSIRTRNAPPSSPPSPAFSPSPSAAWPSPPAAAAAAAMPRSSARPATSTARRKQICVKADAGLHRRQGALLRTGPRAGQGRPLRGGSRGAHGDRGPERSRMVLTDDRLLAQDERPVGRRRRLLPPGARHRPEQRQHPRVSR